MRILITGNMGYVGPQVVTQLRGSYPDAEIVGIDMGFFAHCLSGGPELPERRLDAQYFADVRRPTSAPTRWVSASIRRWHPITSLVYRFSNLSKNWPEGSRL